MSNPYRYVPVPSGPDPQPVTDETRSFRERHRVAIRRTALFIAFAVSVWLLSWGALGFWAIVFAVIGHRARRRRAYVRVMVVNPQTPPANPDSPYDETQTRF